MCVTFLQLAVYLKRGLFILSRFLYFCTNLCFAHSAIITSRVTSQHMTVGVMMCCELFEIGAFIFLLTWALLPNIHSFSIYCVLQQQQNIVKLVAEDSIVGMGQKDGNLS